MAKEKVKRPFYKKVWFWLIVIVVAVAAFGGSGGSGEGSAERSEAAESQQPIEYMPCTVEEMMTLLSENALNASDTYEGKHVEVTGRLGTIDSDGKYISLYPQNDPYAIIGVQCSIQDEAQRDVVATLTSDQVVVVRGKVTSVGEVLGYSLDIDSFVQ